MIAPSIPSFSVPRSMCGPQVPCEHETAAAIRRRLAQTPSLISCMELLALVAEHDLPVLLTGETGAGKTWLARIIHDCSSWRNEPFVAVPCGAMPTQLVESEFFGHLKGAFTGADRPRAGKIAAAGRGTLLLDEVDTLSLEIQAKLLRVLDCGEYEPLGSNETRQRACRIMAASNSDLGELIHTRTFRADLYYRLQVVTFHLPPLRQRIEDIAPLAKDLAARYAANFGKELIDIGPEAQALLESYRWPGNLRELDNILRQAVLFSRGEILLPEHLPEIVRKGRAAAKPRTIAVKESLRGAREAAESDFMRCVLSSCGKNRVRAAKQLGISRATLHKKMKKYGLASA